MKTINTRFQLEYDMYDVSSQADSNPSSATMQPFSNLSLLKDGLPFSGYASMEHNNFILDGTIRDFPESPVVAFVSSDMSNENGLFRNNPTLVINFSEQHSSYGLTLRFEDRYPRLMRVTWLTLKGSVLRHKEVTISGRDVVIDTAVDNYGKIIIEFIETVPYSYIKLSKLLFGRTLEFYEDKVVSGSLVEELDSTSNLLSINTLNFTIFDKDNEYNLGNPEGMHAFIQNKQHIRPYVLFDDEPHYIGSYFVDTVSEENGEVTFDCIDLVGLLDKEEFYWGEIYDGKLAGEIIDKIMEVAGITNYEVDDVTRNIPLYGTIVPGTCRSALREVLFATQSVVDTSRSDALKIFRVFSGINYEIGTDIKISTKVTKAEYISGVEVKYKKYQKNNERVEIETSVYPAGINIVRFTEPVDDIQINPGTIISRGTYFVAVRFNEETEATIHAKKYEATELTVAYNVEKLKSGEVNNVVSYSGTLMDKSRAEIVAKELLNKNSYRLNLDIEYIATTQKVSDWCIVKNPNVMYNDYIAGFSSITTDLTGGFISSASLIGYYDKMDEYYFTGNELVGNDNFVI